MTTERHVMDLLERANPVPDPDDLTIDEGADRFLAHTVKPRSSEMTIIEPTPTQQPNSRWSRGRVVVAVAASVAAIAVAATVLVATRDDTESADPAELPAEEPVVATTVPPPDAAPSADDPMAVIDAYFRAYEEGDTDSVLSLLTADAVATVAYSGSPNPLNTPLERPDVDDGFALRHGRQEVPVDPACAAAVEQPDVGTAITCDLGTINAALLAVDAAPVSTTTLLIVTDGAISEIHTGYGTPNFADVERFFYSWIELHHPDVQAELDAEWTSRDDAERQGRLEAQWASEWAAFLATTGCDYTDVRCELPDEGAADGEEAAVPEPDEVADGPLPTAPSTDDGEPVVMMIPADAGQLATPGSTAASNGTPPPDLVATVAGDSGDSRLPLGAVDVVPDSERLDFLFEFCGDEEACFRDAHFLDPGNPDLGAGPWPAGRPFHVRHGFVNEGTEPLGPDFDVVVYAYEMDEPGQFGGAAASQAFRYESDYVVRGESDACGPTYGEQSGVVTCEWFVHDFPEGLPEGRWAIWAVWEAPCQAWIDLGTIGDCQDPAEVMALFSSGVDSPFDSQVEPAFNEPRGGYYPIAEPVPAP